MYKNLHGERQISGSIVVSADFYSVFYSTHYTNLTNFLDKNCL